MDAFLLFVHGLVLYPPGKLSQYKLEIEQSTEEWKNRNKVRRKDEQKKEKERTQ